MRPLAALLVALALLLGARNTRAAAFAPPVPPAGAVAVGAEVVTVLPALPAGSDEFELFLVPEGGAPIRVSAELPAGATVVRWHMPAVAAHRARLVLRAGGEHAELQSEASALFPLAPLPAGELVLLRTGRSDAGARIVSFAGAAATGLAAAGDPATLSPGNALTAAVEPAPSSLAAPAEAGFAHTPALACVASSPTAHRERSNTPAFTPLRN
jgi:hypothetical protein